MKRAAVLFVSLTLSTGLALAAVTQAQTPPGAEVMHSAKLENASDMELVQMVLEFPPGAWTPVHTHGGLVFASVIDGAVTLREGDKETTYNAGESWKELPGAFMQAGAAGDQPARVLVSFLVPKGAALTTTQHGAANQTNQSLPPGPTAVTNSKFDIRALPGQFDVQHLVLNFPAGAFTPEHTHGGEALVTVLEGEMVHRTKDGERTYKVGETWRETPGEYGVAGNRGDQPARVAVTFLLPKGAPLTTNR